MKSFFKFSAKDFKGILFLVLIIISIHIFRRVRYEQKLSPPELSEHEIAQLKQWEAQLIASMRVDSISRSTKAYSKKSKKNKLLVPQKPFNPNNLNRNDWIKLGFSEKQASSIIKYKNAIHNFKTKSDVGKVFCISEDYFNKIEKLILLPDSIDIIKPLRSKKEEQLKKADEMAITIELNSADSVSLLALKGIGPYWSKRIIKHRNFLGGFYKTNQLTDMKGFPDSLFQAIKPFILVDTLLIKKIDINHFSFDDIKKHPQLWYGVGKSIVNYRDQHGPFQSIEDLHKIYSLKPHQINDLAPYAKFK